MLGLSLRSAAPAMRAFSTSACASNAAAAAAPKVPVALIAKLRKTHPVPMSQAREALEKSNLDVDAAIAYLTSATSASALKKADKVASRTTDEGTIAVSLLGGRRVSIVQLACETDFVARNDVFLSAARGIAETAAFLDVPSDTPDAPLPAGADPIQTFPVDALLSAPLISLPADGAVPAAADEAKTVKQVLLASLAQTSENLKLLRAASFAAPFPGSPAVRFVPGAYTHGGAGTTGKVGGVVVLKVESASETPIATLVSKPKGEELDNKLQALARSLARQVVGFPTKAVSPGNGVADEEALLTQQAMLLGSDKPVADVVADFGKDNGVKVEVVSIRRWSTEDELAPAAEAEGEAKA